MSATEESAWPIYRLKQVVERFYGGGTPDTGDQRNYTDPGNGYPWLMIGDMSKNNLVLSSRRCLSERGLRSRNLDVLPSGTVVYAMYASVGAVAQIAIPAAINQALIGLRPNASRLAARFLVYALEAKRDEVVREASASTQPNISAQKVRNISIAVPSIADQELVVRYLDHAEMRIAKAIASKNNLLISLLEMRRVRIAAGILGTDTSVRLHAGLPFEIPSSWIIEPFWSVAPEVSISGHPEKELLSVYLDRGVIRYSESGGQVHKPSLDLTAYQLVGPHDLVLNNQQAWRGSVGVSRHEGIISPAYVVCRLDDRFDTEYANLLFRSPAMVSQFELASRGVGSIQRQLHRPSLRVLRVPIPPRSEQERIASQLTAETREIDAAVDSLREEIALLKEYRVRLISDVVTGKLDVRAEAANLPDVDPAELAAVLAGGSANTDEEEGSDGDN